MKTKCQRTYKLNHKNQLLYLGTLTSPLYQIVYPQTSFTLGLAEALLWF